MKGFLRPLIRLFVIALVVFTAAAAAGAQQPSQGQGQQPAPKPTTPPGQPAQPATPATPATPPVNQEEEDAYKAFFELKGDDAEAVIRSGEEFVKKFPESRYRISVYSRLTQAYLNTQQLDKLVAAGEKGLELSPDNVDILAILTYSMLRRFNPNDLDAEQKLQKAESYGKRAIELLDKMEKPAQLLDEDFAKAKNEKLSMAHSGLGLAYLHRQRFADSAAELEQATQLVTNPDPTDLYLLGICYQQVKRYGDAATAFGRCGEVTWAWQEQCKQRMEQAKKLAAAQPAAPKP